MGIAEILCAGIITLGIGGSAERGKFACTHIPQIIELSDRFGFQPELMISLIHHESRWHPSAVSHANACGLTQVLPKYTGGAPYPRGAGNPTLTCKQLKDPKTSIDAGSRALRYWIMRYGKGSETIGLCGYNAGFRCRGIPLSRAGRSGMSYARRVLRMSMSLRTFVNKHQAAK
jgi:soluble lytic murein transglycosylase-like protein